MEKLLIEKEALSVLEGSEGKITSRELEQEVKSRLGAKGRETRSAIKALMEKGSIMYTYLHGCSFIEISVKGILRLSKRVVLKPPEVTFNPEEGEVAISLLHGASFGTGQHPTTRLAVKAVEFAFDEGDFLGGGLCLDIGTGSGVLGIAALLMGAEKAIGLDIDPCSRYEAKMNARENGLEERFVVSETPLEKIGEKMDMILANLRCPTLKTIYPEITRMAGSKCAVVLSGFKSDEAPGLIKLYEKGFNLKWEAHEKGWGGALFMKA